MVDAATQRQLLVLKAARFDTRISRTGPGSTSHEWPSEEWPSESDIEKNAATKTRTSGNQRGPKSER